MISLKQLTIMRKYLLFINIVSVIGNLLHFCILYAGTVNRYQHYLAQIYRLSVRSKIPILVLLYILALWVDD